MDKEEYTNKDIKGKTKEDGSSSDVLSNRQQAIKETEKSILKSLGYASGIGLIGVIGYPFATHECTKMLLFLGLMIAGASFITGFFTGNLFGIPKRNNGSDTDYSLNNSLVEIADWLTKIIVGLGLVNLKQIPKYLQSIGEYVNATIKCDNKNVSVFIICLVVYFSVLGIYIGYNYMRLVLSGKYKIADDNLIAALKQKVEQQSKEVVQKSKEVEEQKDKTETLKIANDELSNIASKPQSIDVIKQSNQDNYINEMEMKANQKLKKGLVINAGIDDPQKGMWGGKSEVNNRKISAEVITLSKGNYQTLLTLTSTDQVNNPLKDGEVVLFALHDSWEPAYRLANVINGKAELELYSYGSFTVGVLADRGTTELELDLAELSGVPKFFKEN